MFQFKMKDDCRILISNRLANKNVKLMLFCYRNICYLCLYNQIICIGKIGKNLSVVGKCYSCAAFTNTGTSLH